MLLCNAMLSKEFPPGANKVSSSLSLRPDLRNLDFFGKGDFGRVGGRMGGLYRVVRK